MTVDLSEIIHPTCDACGFSSEAPHPLGDYIYDGWAIRGIEDAFGIDCGSTLCDECAPRPY